MKACWVLLGIGVAALALLPGCAKEPSQADSTEDPPSTVSKEQFQPKKLIGEPNKGFRLDIETKVQDELIVSLVNTNSKDAWASDPSPPWALHIECEPPVQPRSIPHVFSAWEVEVLKAKQHIENEFDISKLMGIPPDGRYKCVLIYDDSLANSHADAGTGHHSEVGVLSSKPFVVIVEKGVFQTIIL